VAVGVIGAAESLDDTEECTPALELIPDSIETRIAKA
jgi:hypothetical protein